MRLKSKTPCARASGRSARDSKRKRTFLSLCKCTVMYRVRFGNPPRVCVIWASKKIVAFRFLPCAQTYIRSACPGRVSLYMRYVYSSHLLPIEPCTNKSCTQSAALYYIIPAMSPTIPYICRTSNYYCVVLCTTHYHVRCD